MQYRVVGGELVNELAYLENHERVSHWAQAPKGALDLAGLSLEAASFSGFSTVTTADGFTPTPIVPGGPLCIQIRHVYTGKYPKDTIFTSKHQDMILTSALKDYSVYAPATRAVNFLSPKVAAHSPLKTPKATEQGTPIIAYYPAVIADSLTLTLDIAFDGFDSGLTNQISSAFKSLGELPMFLSVGGYMLLGGSLVKLAGDVADRLIDGTPKFSQSPTLNFRPDNGPVTAANLAVVCNNSFDASPYRYDWERGLVGKTDDQVYAGDEPYIVLLIDGAERPSLKNFAPTAASAAMLDRFFSARSGAEVAIDGFVQAMRLWNDFGFRSQADEIAKQIDKGGLTDAQKAALVAKYNAFVANIQSEQFGLPKR